MAEKLPQTLANHVRLHPPFHFFVLPLTATAVILAIINVVRHYDVLEAWAVVVLASAAIVAALLTRTNALKAQDRVIRLEERLRLAAILNEPQKSRIAELTEPQLIAIRFASDAEVPGLVDKAINSKLSSSDIKKSIVHWRADIFRV
jgi:Family of unknown function (DUF6526)